jgi:sulfonate transport system substrate-binding protein
MKNRESIIGVLFPAVILALSFVVLSGCSKKKEAAAGLVVRFGYQPGQATITIAKEKGFIIEEFAKDGITFEFSGFVSGPPLITALTAGSLDLGQVGDQPAIAARANDVDIKAIACYEKATETQGLVAAKNSGIKKISDIKGRKIGFTVGSTTHHLLYAYLESIGLAPDDIQRVNLGPGDVVASLVSGNIDAAVTWEPYLSMTTAQGVTDLIATAEGYKRSVNFVIADNAFLQKHPDITVRILNVLDRAKDWIKENMEEAIKIAAAHAGIDAEVLRPTFLKADLSLTMLPEDIAWVERTEDFMYKQNLTEIKVNVGDLIDTSYWKKAGIQ